MGKRLEQHLWSWSGDIPLGRLIAEARTRRGLSQTDVANALGASKANISRIERGADLRVSTLVELARMLRFEPMLVPKEHVTAVRALLNALEDPAADDQPQKPRFA